MADEPPKIPFTPVPLQPRHDGWTPDRQAAFIDALAHSGCVDEACRSVGMGRASAYALRARRDAVSFRMAWDAALDFAIRALADAALSRAINGVARPVFYKGEQIGERRFYDERLTMFLLKHRDPERYGAWRDKFLFDKHPETKVQKLADLTDLMIRQAVEDEERSAGWEPE